MNVTDFHGAATTGGATIYTCPAGFEATILTSVLSNITGTDRGATVQIIRAVGGHVDQLTGTNQLVPGNDGLANVGKGWTLFGGDVLRVTAEANTAVEFSGTLRLAVAGIRVYWGVRNNTGVSEAVVLALGNSEIATQRTKLMKVNASGNPPAGQHVLYAYPAALGAPLGVTVYGHEVAYTLSTATVTTAEGYTGLYNVIVVGPYTDTEVVFAVT